MNAHNLQLSSLLLSFLHSLNNFPDKPNFTALLSIIYSLQTHMQGKENAMSRASIMSTIQGNLQEAMEVLFTQQKTCQKTGKYMEAETIKKRLAKLKVELEKQRRNELMGRFQEEQREVEAAHHEEMNEFHKYWDEKFMEYQSEAQKLEAETLDRHSQEGLEFTAVVEQSIPTEKRESSEVISLRKIEEKMAKQEDYIGAHQIQRQILEIQKRENQKWEYLRQGKIRSLLTQLQSKQAIELSALRQKITQGFQEQKRARECEQQKLVQKYYNFMKELETKHKQEVIRLQKSFKVQSTMSFSRSQASSRVLQPRN